MRESIARTCPFILLMCTLKKKTHSCSVQDKYLPSHAHRNANASGYRPRHSVAPPLDSVTWTLAFECTFDGRTAPCFKVLRCWSTCDTRGYATSRCDTCSHEPAPLPSIGPVEWATNTVRTTRQEFPSPLNTSVRRNDTDTKRYREPESHTRRTSDAI